MFTGLITAIGRIVEVRPGRDARAFDVECSYAADTIPLGASIAHAGACLTVVSCEAVTLADGTSGARYAVEVSNETLSKTTLGAWKVGQHVNLERPLKAGDELGGHWVAGHVDAVGRVAERTADDGSIRFVIEAPWALAGTMAAKGSLAVDGVSLTINSVEDAPGQHVRIGVNIIPHTAEATTLGALAVGGAVNVEADLLARYVLRQAQVAAARPVMQEASA